MEGPDEQVVAARFLQHGPAHDGGDVERQRPAAVCGEPGGQVRLRRGRGDITPRLDRPIEGNLVDGLLSRPAIARPGEARAQHRVRAQGVVPGRREVVGAQTLARSHDDLFDVHAGTGRAHGMEEHPLLQGHERQQRGGFRRRRGQHRIATYRRWRHRHNPAGVTLSARRALRPRPRCCARNTHPRASMLRTP